MVSLSSLGVARDCSKSKITSISYGALITVPGTATLSLSSSSSGVFKKTEKGITEFTCILSVGRFNSKIKLSGRVVSSIPTRISVNPILSFMAAVMVVWPTSPVVTSNLT